MFKRYYNWLISVD